MKSVVYKERDIEAVLLYKRIALACHVRQFNSLNKNVTKKKNLVEIGIQDGGAIA